MQKGSVGYNQDQRSSESDGVRRGCEVTARDGALALIGPSRHFDLKNEKMLALVRYSISPSIQAQTQVQVRNWALTFLGRATSLANIPFEDPDAPWHTYMRGSSRS
jgi:hypothetical protein